MTRGSLTCGSEKSNSGQRLTDVPETNTTLNQLYSATKKNEMMPCAATHMDLETIVLSEAGQTEREKYQMVSIYVGSKKRRYK